jgi:hypothetical protein
MWDGAQWKLILVKPTMVECFTMHKNLGGFFHHDINEYLVNIYLSNITKTSKEEKLNA